MDRINSIIAHDDYIPIAEQIIRSRGGKILEVKPRDGGHFHYSIIVYSAPKRMHKLIREDWNKWNAVNKKINPSDAEKEYQEEWVRSFVNRPIR